MIATAAVLAASVVREGGYEVDGSSDAGEQAGEFCRRVNGVSYHM